MCWKVNVNSLKLLCFLKAPPYGGEVNEKKEPGSQKSVICSLNLTSAESHAVLR